MFKIKKQLAKLYSSSVLGNLSLTGAWVAILAARGYSLVEIGIAETVFHITSLIFEIPSGVLADVFGRKKMLIVSSFMRMVGNIIMILSDNLFMVCLSIAFHALSYNFSSGTGNALAYDSLKTAKMESGFERYMSNQLMIYRLCSGISTLCAGFALFIGHKIAYGTDLVTGAVQILILVSLCEIHVGDKSIEKRRRGFTEIGKELTSCFKESLFFLKKAKKAVKLMMSNSLVGAVDTLLLFFLQAKLRTRLPEWGLGFALLFMEMGGIVGSKLIIRLPRLGYKTVFVITALLVLAGVVAEHLAMWQIMTLGGFLAAAGDDAIQVRTNAALQDMFPSKQRATLTSAESFSFSVIMIILSPLAGFAFTYW
ncbi:MAG: MFS transporter [Oscillospiraceae bacterium]|nr:MFS transporter [Oscillospiraceae bacterium]